MATDYRALMKVSSEDVERPVIYPSGYYKGIIRDFGFGNSSKKKTPFVEVQCDVYGPIKLDDDDAELDGMDFTEGKRMSVTYYLSPKAKFMLTDMLDAVLGESPGAMADDRIDDIKGQECTVRITPRDNQPENAPVVLTQASAILAPAEEDDE